MASIVVAGDVSGTVTLSAPATAGTTTLTLPTTTGTVLASNSATTLNSGASAMTLQTNGTTAMTIDTSQNVGIGTASPSQRLHVRSNNGQILAEATGTNENPSLKLTAATNNRNWEIFSWSGVSGQFGIYDGIAGQNRLLIDTSGNLQFNSGYGSVATAFGCRAWVNFNGTGTVAIRASGNVSSITDNNIGDYTINFTTAMPDTNYAVVTGMSGNANNTNGNEFYVSTQIAGPAYNAGYTTTGSIRMLSMDGTGSNRDCADLNLAVFR